MADERLRAIDVVDLLNDLIGDIGAGVNMLRDYDRKYKNGNISLIVMVPVQRMCLSHLILALSKWKEVHQKYHDLFPVGVAPTCRNLNKEIEKRGVVKFRNICAGHIWDNSAGRPLVHSEIMGRLEVITRGDLSGFLRWLNDPQKNLYPSTVISIVEYIKDAIMETYDLDPSEVIDR